MTNVFSMYILCEETRCKLVINKYSAMNVISNHAITRENLMTKPHTKLFHNSCVNHMSLLITHRCVVPIKIGVYIHQI